MFDLSSGHSRSRESKNMATNITLNLPKRSVNNIYKTPKF